MKTEPSSHASNRRTTRYLYRSQANLANPSSKRTNVDEPVTHQQRGYYSNTMPPNRISGNSGKDSGKDSGKSGDSSEIGRYRQSL